MILDYKNDREFALANGIFEEDRYYERHFKGDTPVRDIVFRNFPKLLIAEKSFVHCSFENCEMLEITGCNMLDCTFQNANVIYSHYSNFYSCIFEDCSVDNEALLSIDTKGEIDGCRFVRITAKGENGCVIDSTFGKKSEVTYIKNCVFEDCDAPTIAQASYFVPLSYRKTKAIDNIDYDICKFCGSEGEAIEIGSFDLSADEDG